MTGITFGWAHVSHVWRVLHVWHILSSGKDSQTSNFIHNGSLCVSVRWLPACVDQHGGGCINLHIHWDRHSWCWAAHSSHSSCENVQECQEPIQVTHTHPHRHTLTHTYGGIWYCLDVDSMTKRLKCVLCAWIWTSQNPLFHKHCCKLWWSDVYLNICG